MTNRERLEEIRNDYNWETRSCDDDMYFQDYFKQIEKDLEILEQYKNIEKELGIDLITLFKALKQEKVWTKYKNKIDCCDCCQYMFLANYIDCYWDNGKRLVFALKDYGKTWALDKSELIKEELENEQ